MCTGSFLRLFAALAILALFPIKSSGELAPRPENDDRANAIDVGTGSAIVVSGTTLGATQEPGEPRDSNIVAAVWYKWSPAVSGPVQFNIRKGTPNIRVYRDAPPLEMSRNHLSFDATAGETYYLAVFAGAEPGMFEFLLQIVSHPPNDNFADAIELTASADGVFEVQGFSAGATNEPGEQHHPTIPGSVWFKWSPMKSGRVVCSLSQLVMTGLVPPIWIFAADGSGLENLRLIGKEYETPYVIAGETYYFAVCGNSYPFTFRADVVPGDPNIEPPPNNHLQRSLEVGTGPVLLEGTTVGAIHPWVWFTWRSTNAAIVRYTILSGSPNISTSEGRGDEAANKTGFISEVARTNAGFISNPGVVYYLAVSTDAPGPFQFRLETLPVETNDLFKNAIELDGSSDSVEVLGSGAGAGTEPGEPGGAQPFGGSIWYKWTPARSGRVHYTKDFRDAWSRLRFFRANGPEITDLVLIADHDEFADLEAGKTYYIAVYAPYFQVPAHFWIRLATAPPPNDTRQNAISLEVTNGLAQVRGTTFGATHDSTDPEYVVGATVWYKWTPDFYGPVLFEIAAPDIPGNWSSPSSDYDYGGNWIRPGASMFYLEENGSLTPAQGPAGTVFVYHPGATYFIAVSSQSPGWKTTFQLTMKRTKLPQTLYIDLEQGSLVYFGGGPVPLWWLQVFASSDYQVSLKVLGGPGEIRGGYLYVSDAGYINIEVSQPGDWLYEPAIPQPLYLKAVPLPKLAVSSSDGKILLTWENPSKRLILEMAKKADGDWSPIPDQGQIPGRVELPAADQACFFRLRTWGN